MDGDFDMARERAAAIAGYDDIRLLEDSLDIETCEGAATIGLELADTMPSFYVVLIALGGGVLPPGVGHVIKARAPGVEVSAPTAGRSGDDTLLAPAPRRHHRPDQHHCRRRRPADPSRPSWTTSS